MSKSWIKKLNDDNVSSAVNLADEWKYADFVDPITGLPCLPIEYVFGSRGILIGRMMKIEADQSVGKSSLLFTMYAMFQKMCGAYCTHLESEGAAPPPDYIASLGCDPTSLAIKQPGSIERCMASIEDITIGIRKEVDNDITHPAVFGVDSVSGFGSDAELDSDSALDLTKTAGLGGHARCLSRWFRDRGGVWMSKNGVILLMTAQLKDKILTGPEAMHATKDMKKGTLAEKPLNFNATYRVELRTSVYRDEERRNIGDLITIKTLKNKLSPKDREIQVPLIREKGFNFIDITCDFLKTKSPILLSDGTTFIVEQKGPWLSCPTLSDKNVKSNPEGKEQLVRTLYSNSQLLTQIREALRIRGFGFKFETDYLPSNPERDDNMTKE